MKKFKIVALVLVAVLALGLLAGCGTKELEAQVADLQKKLDEATATIEGSNLYSKEPFTTASVPFAKYDKGVTLDEVATNVAKGSYLIATTNPDGTPNVGYEIYSYFFKKIGEKFYLSVSTVYGTKPSTQSYINLAREGQGVLVWIDQYDYVGNEGKAFTTRGIKMWVSKTTDAAAIAELNPDAKATTFVFEVVRTLPIG